MSQWQELQAEFGLGEKQLEQLQAHWDLVRQAAKHFNLTSILDDQQALIKHYWDSLTALSVLDGLSPQARLLDMGSGAGFPGLVLAIARPRQSFILLDATRKKCDFLQQCRDELQLANVDVRWGRAEEAGRDPLLRARLEGVLARAVAPLNVLAELALPLLAPGGVLLAMKGAAAVDELTQAEHALKVLGGQAQPPRVLALPGGDQRQLLIVKKIKPTPEAYPRRSGLPQKKPL